MPYRYALAEHGKTLATRPLGKELRADLVQNATGEGAVLIDFSEVLSTSHSFADEFVAKLFEEIAEGEVDLDVSLLGVSADVERVVSKALERRDLQLPALA